MIDKRKALRLLGESIRDIGILVVVFAPLDAFFQKDRPSAVVVILIIILALIFVGIGIMLEAEE